MADGHAIEVRYQGATGDFFSLTDIAKYRTTENPGYVIQNWMRNRNTIRSHLIQRMQQSSILPPSALSAMQQLKTLRWQARFPQATGLPVALWPTPQAPAPSPAA